MQDMCGVLFDIAEQTGRNQADKMLSVLQNKSFHLAVFRTTSNTLRYCEDVLKIGAEKYCKEGGFEKYVTAVEENWYNMAVMMYGRNEVDVLRRQLSLTRAG